MTIRLPSGWVATTIGNIANYVQRGRSPSYAPHSSFPVVNQKCVRWGGVDPDHVKFINEATRNQWGDERLLRDGDILWNSTGTGTLGRAAIFRGLPGFDDVVADSHVTIVRVSAIDPRYVHYWIRGPEVQGRLAQMQSGSTNQVELPRAAVVATDISLAPLNEQRRIVAKLDAIFEQTRAAKARLEQLPPLLESLKRSILAAAFRGDLTSDWRSAHPDVKPANVLLDRVRAEHRRGWESDVRAKGKDPAKATYEPPARVVDDTPSLPTGWCWASVDELTDLQLGQQRSPVHAAAKETHPYIRAANIKWDGLDLSDVKEMGFPNPDRYLLRDGDVLLSEASGSPSEVGKPAIWRNEIEGCCYQKTLLRARPRSSEVLSEWLYMAFLADASLGRFAAMAPGVGIVHLTADRMFAWPIPLAPLAEQEEIIVRLQTALAAIHRLATTTAINLSRTSALEQAAIAKAFRGELVPQDPTDEPASELLAKVTAERHAADAEPPPRHPKTPRKRTSMSNGDKDAIKAAILKLKTDRFSFDELKAQVAGDYESLKAALFELLEEPTPMFRQAFDKKAKAMVLVRVRP